MLRHREPCHLDGGSPGDQTNGKTDVSGEYAMSRHGTSTRRSKWLLGDVDRPNEQPDGDDDDDDDDDDDRGCPPAPATLDGSPISHDTDINLKLLINGNDKGDFLRLQTSVKVCVLT